MPPTHSVNQTGVDLTTFTGNNIISENYGKRKWHIEIKVDYINSVLKM